MLEKAVKDLRPKIVMRGFPRVEIRAEVEKIKGTIQGQYISPRGYRSNRKRSKNNQFPALPEDIKSEMKLSEGDVFDQTQFNKDIERIKTYL